MSVPGPHVDFTSAHLLYTFENSMRLACLHVLHVSPSGPDPIGAALPLGWPFLAFSGFMGSSQMITVSSGTLHPREDV